jgi:hypothetical protein
LPSTTPRLDNNSQDYPAIFVCYSNPVYNYFCMKKAFFSLLLVILFGSAVAQTYKQYPLFVYSFTRYIQWPEAYNQGDFEILVLGDSPVTEELKIMAQSKKVGERPIKVTQVSSLPEIKKCHILFLPFAQSDKLSEVIQKVNSQPVLIMTEGPGLGRLGSCINFIVKDGKLAFELNQSAFARQNLKASAELTRLAIMI